MKKLLALVLALVMTLSLCVTSNAAYSDAADVDYKEAVDVMTAIGVFNGDENGKFNPDGILTREQAAKIVTYMLLGKKNADTLVTIAAPFADVEATRWSAGSIAYCYNEGILAGVGAGKFDPAGQLTGLAFAKMMLTALGYDAEVEGLTGANWSINTAKLALQAGLTDGMDDVVLSAPMTREQAAKMALNTELATMVQYNDNTTITAGNVTVKTQSDATKVPHSASSGYKKVGNDAFTQFCEEYAKDLCLTEGKADGMGHPAVEWKVKTTSVGTYAEEADYAGYVTVKNNTTAKVVDSFSKKFKDATADVTVNGAASTLATAVSTGDYVELFMDEDDTDLVLYIVITHKSVAKLTADAATKVNGSDEMVKVPGVTHLNTYTTDYTTENVTGYAGLKEDDIVLYFEDADKNVTIEKADSFAGVLTAASGTTYTVSGSKYEQSGVTGSMSGITVTNFVKEDATWYVDDNGNVAWVEGTEASEVAYVVATKTTTNSYTGSGAASTYSAMLLFPDGTVQTVATKAAAAEDTFVKYIVKDEVYELTLATANTEATVGTETVTVAKGNPNVDMGTTTGNVLTNADTLFFVRDYDTTNAHNKDTYTIYTGYAAVPSMSYSIASNRTAVAYVGSDGYADYVVLDPVSNISGLSTASDLFFVVDNTVKTLYDADGAYGYTVKAVKGGELVDLEFATSPTVAENSAYKITNYNKDGQVNSFGLAITTGNEFVVASGITKATSTVFGLNSTAYAFTDKTVVYYVNADDEMSVLAVADLETDANDTFVAIRASKTSSDDDYNTITTLYVRQVKTDVTAPSFSTNLSSTGSATVGSPFTAPVVVASAANVTTTYEWYLDGAKVEGQTAATFSYTFAAAGTHTLYCKATNNSTVELDGAMTKSLDSAVMVITVA